MKEIVLRPNEVIKPIDGYESLYSITSFGRIYSHKRLDRFGRKIKSRFRKLQLNRKKGYLQLNLYRNGKYKSKLVHRLVSIAYISNPNNFSEINHKDGIKTNNFKNNLEWCSSQENHNHASINNLRPFKKYSKYYGVSLDPKHRGKNKWRCQTTLNHKEKHIGIFYTEIEAAKSYNNFVIKHNLNRPLNEINEEEYLKAVREHLKIMEDDKKRIKNRGVVYIGNIKNPWMSSIKINGISKYLGIYKTKIEALKAYNDFIIEHNINRPLNKIEGV